MARPPLSETSDAQRRELLGCLDGAAALEDLPGKWQAALVASEQDEPSAGGGCGHCHHH